LRLKLFEICIKNLDSGIRYASYLIDSNLVLWMDSLRNLRNINVILPATL
jgi:hypothetical protein